MSAKPTAHSRLSSTTTTTTTPQVKPTCKIHPSATIADKASLTGAHTITIGENAIIHPHAKLRADHGNIFIGSGCIIAEKAVVGLTSAPDERDGEVDVVIADGVSIESGAVVEARRVGEHAVVGINARVGQGAVVGKWCKVCALEEVREREVLEDFTVVFGEGEEGRRLDVGVRERKEVSQARLKGLEMEREMLKGIIVDNKMKWTSA